jgi:hypothetical protein
MRRTLVCAVLSVVATCASAEDWFGREIVPLARPADYKYRELDGLKHPALDGRNVTVSCLVARGDTYYYVQIGLINRSDHELSLPDDVVLFDKPLYTVVRMDTEAVAEEIGGGRPPVFVLPPPPPSAAEAGAFAQTAVRVPHVHAWRRRPDPAYPVRSTDAAVAQLLAAGAQETHPAFLKAGESRLLLAVFRQTKPKRAPFTVRVTLDGERFVFDQRE